MPSPAQRSINIFDILRSSYTICTVVKFTIQIFLLLNLRILAIYYYTMATSHPEFNRDTEGLDVAKAFPDGIRNKTIIVTGANRDGVGFSTSHAFVSCRVICQYSGCIC